MASCLPSSLDSLGTKDVAALEGVTTGLSFKEGEDHMSPS